MFAHGLFRPYLLPLLILLAANPGFAQETGPVAGSDTSTVQNPSSYGKPNQSRVWYNAEQNRWDALVPKNDGGVSASDHYIIKDVDGSQLFTDIELEDRNFGRPDVFWDDASNLLYVLTSHPAQSQFWRVGYDANSDTYNIEIGALGSGVPVPGITHPNIGIGGNSPATLYVTPNGGVWVAVMANNGLQVQHSSDGGASWLAAPVSLNSAAELGVTTWIDFEFQGTTRIGVFASENGEMGNDTDFFFWYIDQDHDPSVLANWVDDSADIPTPIGAERSDDHDRAARDAVGNQYFVVKTEGGNPTDPLIKLFRRTPAGAWTQFEVTETQDVPEESRPSILIDNQNNELYLYSTGAEIVGPNFREGRRIKAPLDSLEDLASAPSVTIFSQPGTVFTDIISPRAGVDATSGIVVLAHNRTAQTVWFGREDIQSVDLVRVPDVVDLTQAAATAAITAASLRVGNVTTVNSERVPAGNVISQDPVGGTAVPPDTAVDLVVSLGPTADLIPGFYPISGGNELKVKEDVTMNGRAVAEARTRRNSVVDINGTRSTVSQNLPPLQPANFPANNSSQDADHSDSPFISSGAVFYEKIEIEDDQSAVFDGGGPFHINELEINEDATVNLSAGTYFIKTLKLDKKRATINVTSGPVLLHIGDKFDVGDKDARVNIGGSAAGLRVFLHEDAEFKGDDELNFTGLIYGPQSNEVEVKKKSIFRGAIIISDKIKIGDDVVLTYTAQDQVAVSAISPGGN